jgi:hypothetical protein
MQITEKEKYATFLNLICSPKTYRKIIERFYIRLSQKAAIKKIPKFINDNINHFINSLRN